MKITDILNFKIQEILIYYGVHDILGADDNAEVAVKVEALFTKEKEELIKKIEGMQKTHNQHDYILNGQLECLACSRNELLENIINLIKEI